MRQLILLAGLLILNAGCSSESAFPNPTGKGTVRAINAIKGSPDVAFRIEESVIENLSYKDSSPGRRWDDFQYTFNFDVFFLGEDQARRIARSALKVDAGGDFTFVLTGDIQAPAVEVWEGAERSFSETETTVEARFAHAAASLGDIDVYFAASGILPAIGEERGTLSFGESLGPQDFDAGDYVLTVTTAGNPADIKFESAEINYAAQNAYIIPILDGDELDVAPFTVRLINARSGAASLADVRFPPTVRFVQASPDLAAADVYDDEMLMNQVLANHLFGDASGDINASVGTTTFRYTPTGETSAILFEDDISISSGTHNNFIVIGREGSRLAFTFEPDRRSISNIAKLQILPLAQNQPLLDLYILDADAVIDDATRTGVLGYAQPTGSIQLEAGSYDIYMTVTDEKTLLSAPVRLDVQLGDVVEAVILDATDPATAEFVILPAP